ncbi:endoribonuclease l-psp [Lasius niger]|uniref:Endoribonuclease l-psp n=1 Tax=Lasius niger TaxID=67767 RepID=A0A0J7JZU8_LASNI|nr:endoribonuclease l-psp [Lasius niger]
MQALSGQRSWAYAGAPTLNESELGLLFSQGRYSLGLNLRSEASAPTNLPRLLPGPVQTGALADLSRGTQVGAVGRLALDRLNSIHVGASVGHYDLLPGNSLHVSVLEQKSLSLGIEHGPVSGTVVGRVVEPQNGVSANAYGPERSWSSVDIGVTLYLPWQGQINVGARNLWRSGQSPSQLPNPSRIDPDQARTPYVQYRQDFIVSTSQAPAAIGPYSQAVRVGQTVYFSGQIPLDPASGELVAGGIEAQTRQVFENLQAVAAAAGGQLADIVRLGIYVTDLAHFGTVNQVMAEYFAEPYPARSTIEVSALPKAAQVEVDAILVLD